MHHENTSVKRFLLDTVVGGCDANSSDVLFKLEGKSKVSREIYL